MVMHGFDMPWDRQGPGASSLLRRRRHAIGLNPAHEKRYDEQCEQANRQGDAQCQEANGPIGLVAILDQRDHTSRQANQDGKQQQKDDGF